MALWRLADKAEVGKVESLEGELTGGIFQCLSKLQIESVTVLDWLKGSAVSLLNLHPVGVKLLHIIL